MNAKVEEKKETFPVLLSRDRRKMDEHQRKVSGNMKKTSLS